MDKRDVEALLGGLAHVPGNLYEDYVKPHVTARNAWIMLAGSVAVYDWIAPQGEMLSEGVDRALEKHPIVTTLAVGAVALHLLNVLPKQIDPLHQVTRFFEK